MKKYCFSGKMHVGKDYVANKKGCKIFGFADPLYRICEFYFGLSDKRLDGVREFLQKVGQWGRGTITKEYPLTTDRALFVDYLRNNGYQVTDFGDPISWDEFGENEDFWLNLLIKRIQDAEQTGENGPVAVTNVRFENELWALKANGFAHFHVSCSEDTYISRFEKSSGKDFYGFESQNIRKDISERFSDFLEESGDVITIWNDNNCLMPNDPKYISLEDFLKNY